MSWKPIIIGVDGSEESSRAASVGWAVAQAAQAECYMVHAARDRWAAVRDLTVAAAATIGGSSVQSLPTPPHPDTEDIEEHRERLLPTIPEGAADRLVIEFGRPTTVLHHAREEHDASLIVTGGKHHAGLGKWIVGSSVHELVRTLEVPLLVVGDAPATLSRILVAVDLSPDAPRILAEAQRFAALSEAALLALHVVAEVPFGTEYAHGVTREALMNEVEEIANRHLWSALTLPRAETRIRYGPALETILNEVREWDADLLVVGSHGHGWDGRMLLGGTTAALLDDLPVSLLVVPVT